VALARRLAAPFVTGDRRLLKTFLDIARTMEWFVVGEPPGREDS
jgi:hypothetical protein